MNVKSLKINSCLERDKIRMNMISLYICIILKGERKDKDISIIYERNMSINISNNNRK